MGNMREYFNKLLHIHKYETIRKVSPMDAIKLGGRMPIRPDVIIQKCSCGKTRVKSYFGGWLYI